MSVFDRILAEVPTGLKLKTPSLKKPFKVKTKDSDKLVFFIKTIDIEVSKESWDGIPAFLGKGWIKIGANHIASSKLDDNTLEKYLRDKTSPNKKHSQGSYLAPLLEYLGIAEIDRKRPAKIRIKDASPDY